MKALTICQPFAHLIVTPAAELPPKEVPKRIENRRWRTDYKGLLLIHAGLSTEWLGDWDSANFPTVRGAILGVCELLDCVLIEMAGRDRVIQYHVAQRWPWLATHPHAEGPWGFVLGNVRRFREPIPQRGAQGLFDVAEDLLLTAAIDNAEPIADPFVAPKDWKAHLAEMSEPSFASLMQSHFPADHFAQTLYRERGRSSVIAMLAAKLSKQPEAAR